MTASVVASSRLVLRAPAWVAPLCWAAVLLDGFDAVVLGAVLPSLLDDPNLGLTPVSATAVATIGLVGMMVGALAMGYLTDRLGRRRLLMASIVVFSLFTLLAAFATTPFVFGLWRFVAGIGLGGCLPTSIALINEFARGGRQGNATTTLMTGYHVGAVATAGLALVLLKPFGWHGMFVAGALPVLVIVPLIYFFVPESPAYLLARGRRAEAQAVAAHYGLTLDDPAQDAVTEQAHTPPDRQGVSTLLKGALARNSVAIWVTSFMGLLLVYGLNTWLPQIMRKADYDLGNALGFLFVLNVGAVVGLLFAGRIADRITPRAAAIIWFAGSAAFLAALAIRLPIAGIYVMVFLTGCFVFSSQVLVYAFTAANHPGPIRATALGMAAGVGRLGAISGPLLGGVLLERGLAYPWGFFAFALVGVLGALGMLATHTIATPTSPKP